MDFYGIQLEIALAALGILALLVAAFRPDAGGRVMGLMAAAVVGVLAVSFAMVPLPDPLFGGLYRLDAFALFFKRALLAAVALALMLAADFAPLRREGGAEFAALTLFATVGMLVLVSVNDLLLLFVALELVTISFYVLVSFLRRETAALEAGTKYLVLGALSASLVVYGIAYMYGAAGHLQFDNIIAALDQLGGAWPAYRFGCALLLLGVGFKLAMVPMQIWAPDVYQGAPTPATALLASASKVAGFALLIRIGGLFPFDRDPAWMLLPAGLALLTLFWGTLGALGQTDLKRLLGYSSIAHAGYLLLGFAALNGIGLVAMGWYLVQYIFATLAAFLVIAAVGGTSLAALAGLHRRAPFLALALFLAMMSLAGVPPLSGAVGKFFLLLAVVHAGAAQPYLYWLAGAGALCSVIAVVFYFAVLRAAFIAPAPGDLPPVHIGKWTRLALAICVAALVLLGLWPQPLWSAATAILPW